MAIIACLLKTLNKLLPLIEMVVVIRFICNHYSLQIHYVTLLSTNKQICVFSFFFTIVFINNYGYPVSYMVIEVVGLQ